MDRYLRSQIETDLERKMVFVGGPRQVGKTNPGEGASWRRSGLPDYVRDVDGHEVDFVLTENRRPFALIECKLSARGTAPALRLLAKKSPEASATLVVAEAVEPARTLDGIVIRSAWDFLAGFV